MNKTNVIMLNIWVALLQLTTTPLFFVGWIWSVIWSAKFVIISSKLSKLSLTHLLTIQQRLLNYNDYNVETLEIKASA